MREQVRKVTDWIGAMAQTVLAIGGLLFVAYIILLLFAGGQPRVLG